MLCNLHSNSYNIYMICLFPVFLMISWKLVDSYIATSYALKVDFIGCFITIYL